MEIKVCIGSACHLKGSYDVIQEFQKALKELKLEEKIILKGAFCLNHCTEAVSTEIDGKIVSMSPGNVKQFVTDIAEENGWSI